MRGLIIKAIPCKEQRHFIKLVERVLAAKRANPRADTSKVKSVPTQRAADKWDSPRFMSIFLASGLYCPQAVSTSRPLAACILDSR